MITIKRERDCQGCEACVSICPKNCITMTADKDGFRYPMVDTDSCVNCHLCEKVCPDCDNIREILNRNSGDINIVKCYSNDGAIRMASSSGGIFSILAEEVIRQKGCVFGVRKLSVTELEHVCIENIDEVADLRGSKYFQSHINESYRSVKQKLNTGEKVLFVGTPCQVAALYSYLGRDDENLFTCDLKCHGVPSPESFLFYCKSMEKHTGKKVQDYFRDKSKGWDPVIFTTVMEDGEKISKEAYTDEFNIAFINSMNLRPSCYDCKFAYIPRIGDITLSDNFIDAHNADKKDQFMGLSMLSLNSSKGYSLYSSVKDKMNYSEHELKGRALFGWMSGCKTYSACREEFMSRYKNEDFLDLIHELKDRSEGKKGRFLRFCKKVRSEINKYTQRYTH